MTDRPTVADTVARALGAYAALAELGEEVEDEWTYVTDLTAAWRERLELVATERGAATLEAEADEAIALAEEEIGQIVDPHRAIDWLSTFPQIVLLALDADA